MAYTSAELISSGGMGNENKHMKESVVFRSTPPVALQLRIGSREASIFHFKEEFDGGLQVSLLIVHCAQVI